MAVEIETDRITAFLEAMKVDVAGTRSEEGCLAFGIYILSCRLGILSCFFFLLSTDLLRDTTNPQKFYFYEVYKNDAAIDVHKTTEHYKVWVDFKKGGGVISQTVIKADAIDVAY